MDELKVLDELEAFFNLATKQYKEFCEIAKSEFHQPDLQHSTVRNAGSRIEVVLHNGTEKLYSVTFFNMRRN